MIKDFCSIGSTWNQKNWLKWAIPGLIGLLLLTLLTRCSPIENDLGQKTQSLLGENNMSWAQTSLDGRDVTLTGEAPSEVARDSAIELTEGVYGVRTVDHDISLKQWTSSSFNLKQDGELVVLTGEMPDQASIDEAVSKAHSLYGDVNVTNKLEISDSARAPAWLAGTTGMMAAMLSTRNLAMNVTDEKLEISGEVETEAEKAQLIAEAKANYGENFSESINVVKTRPTAEELAAIAAAKLAEEERVAAEARKIAEAEAARLAEEHRLAMEAKKAEEEAALLAAAEAEAARKAEAERLAKIAAEEKRLADLEATKIKQAKAELTLLASCQSDFDQILADNPTLFDQNESTIIGSSYPTMGMLAQKINYCSDILHKKNQYIDVTANTGEADNSPLDDLTRQHRIYSAISYLEIINGAHPGLLRPSSETATDSSSTSQLQFNISE